MQKWRSTLLGGECRECAAGGNEIGVLQLYYHDSLSQDFTEEEFDKPVFVVVRSKFNVLIERDHFYSAGEYWQRWNITRNRPKNVAHPDVVHRQDATSIEGGYMTTLISAA